MELLGPRQHHRSCQRVLEVYIAWAVPGRWERPEQPSIGTTTPLGASLAKPIWKLCELWQAFGAFQSSSSCVVSWRSVPGSFGSLFVAPAPICETVCCCAVSWHSVPGSFGHLIAEPAPICEIVYNCLLNCRSVPGSFGPLFGLCAIGLGNPPAICGISRHRGNQRYQRAGLFQTLVRLLGHRISDPPAICRIFRHRSCAAL